MKKYSNKNFKISAPEIVGIVLFLGLLIVSAFFYKSFNEVDGLFNIKRTKVDYIIQAPSKEQIEEICSLNHVNKAVPYLYRSINAKANQKSVASTLFIIEDEKDAEFTTFSNELLIEKDESLGGNHLYITDDFSKNAGIGVGDEVQIQLDNQSVSFIVAGLFKSDNRRVGGSLLAFMSDEIKGVLSREKYSGAFISSSNISASDSYFKNEYKPMGDLRSREEFDSDEAYNTYLETREQTDSTKDSFVTSEYIADQTKRNETKLIRNLAVSLGCILVALIVVLLIFIVRTKGYTKNNVLKDIKDNFSIEQEVSMYRKYFLSCSFCLVLASGIALAVAHLLNWINAISWISIVPIASVVIVVCVVASASIRSLRHQFLIENKKLENK